MDLKDENPLLGTVWAMSRDGMRLVDATGTVLRVNEAYCAIMGVGRQELESAPVGRAYAEKDGADELRRIQELFCGKRETRTAQISMRLRNGERLRVQQSDTLIERGGQAPRVLSILHREATVNPGHDVVARAPRKSPPLRSREHLEKAFLFGPDPICISTLDEGRFLDANDAFLEVTGYSRDELIGKTSVELGIWHDASHRNSVMRSLWLGERVRNVEVMHRMKSGEMKTLLLSAELIDVHGLRCLISFNRDITDRKQLERVRDAAYKISALAQSDASLDEVFRSIHKVISQLMPAENLYFAMYDRASDLLTFPYFVDTYDLPPAPRRPGKGLTEYVLRTGKPLLASPEKFSELVQDGEVESMGTPSIDWVGVPLTSAGATIGVLVVQTYSSGVRYTHADRDMLQFVSAQVAMTIGRKQAEQRIAASERKFRTVFENSNDGIMVIQSGKIVDCNPKIERIFGGARVEVVGRPASAFFTSDHREGALSEEEFAAKIDAALGGSPQFFECVQARHDGCLFDIEVSLTRIAIDQGDVVQAIVRDITSRKSVEDALRKYEFIANATGDMMTLVGPEYIYEAANDAYCRAHGKRREEIVGQSMRDVWGEEVFLAKIKSCMDACLRGEEVHYQAEFDFPLLGMRSFDVTYYPYRRDRNAATHAVVVSHDITERIRAEEQLKSSLREKEVLLREIHHRVKNNLQVISSLLSLQAGQIQDSRNVEVFRESQNRIRTMALIHEKLYRSADFSRVDFADYVQGLMTFLFRSYGGTERSIGLQIDVQGVTLGVDVAIPCGLIINELVSNSLKHAFPGREKGTIRVRMHETEQRFVLELSDDGIGFPRNVDFRNTDSLGLQLVTTLAAQIGARITKQSDQGTSYTITFQNPGY